MIIQVEKQNSAIVQGLKQENPRLYEALRKSDRIDVPTKEVHGFGNSGTVEVGNSLFPPLIITHPLTLVLILLTFNTPPTGADFIADIKKRSTGASILKAPIIFPAGFTGVVDRNEFGISTFAKYDVLICDILQVGSTVPGSFMNMYMHFNIGS
jgi:hypothetical protein